MYHNVIRISHFCAEAANVPAEALSVAAIATTGTIATDGRSGGTTLGSRRQRKIAQLRAQSSDVDFKAALDTFRLCLDDCGRVWRTQSASPAGAPPLRWSPVRVRWALASRAVGGGPSGGSRATAVMDGSVGFTAKPTDGCQGLALQ